MTPRVSIVIPTYNQASFLRDCLKSVQEQTVDDWEAIVVNNYSDDDTVQVAEAARDRRIRVVNFRNHGVIAASRNTGIRQSRAEWVAFLDSDDLWTADKLERCLAVADDHADIISHPEVIVRNGQVIGHTSVGTPQRAEYRNLLFRGNIFSPTAILVRRAMLDAVGGFAEEPSIVTAEDYDLWLRLARQGARCRFVDRPLSQYTLHGGQASASILRHLNANLAVLDRHLAELSPRRFGDGWRSRHGRALVIYGAARASRKGGDWSQALALFARALALDPVSPRLYAGLALAALGR